ncbi:MAG: hypothetical protein CVU84_02105 [Firmicutes bacterium HGW-Firmicutes-1]|nr:MAG: hypothetical protein CVU84_02105 [Firmicutes bacterium HGW-Firmicutes-1]
MNKDKSNANKHEPDSINSGVIVGDNTNISGNVAGRDIIINNNYHQREIDELVRILDLRTERINNNLSMHFKYAEIKIYLDEFNILHKSHIESLKKGDFIYAHELLTQIHDLSYRLESDEFWSRHRIETPFLLYSLRPDSFTRGELICAYIVGDMRKYSDKYLGTELSDHNASKNNKDIIMIYKKITQSV